MSKLVQEGFRISQNVLFRKLGKRASFLLGTPVKLGMLLTSAYGIITKDKGEGESGFAHVKDVLSSFMRMVKQSVSGSYHGVPKMVLVKGVAVLLYLVSPIDLVPDFIPGLGFLDDISLITWFVSTIKDEISRFEDWEVSQHFNREVQLGRS